MLLFLLLDPLRGSPRKEEPRAKIKRHFIWFVYACRVGSTHDPTRRCFESEWKKNLGDCTPLGPAIGGNVSRTTSTSTSFWYWRQTPLAFPMVQHKESLLNKPKISEEEEESILGHGNQSLRDAYRRCRSTSSEEACAILLSDDKCPVWQSKMTTKFEGTAVCHGSISVIRLNPNWQDLERQEARKHKEFA